jgi:glycosyltransferase involved in cell wall biosynthesis
MERYAAGLPAEGVAGDMIGTIEPTVMPLPAAALPIETGSIQASPRDLRSPPARVLHVVNGEHYAGAERVQDHLAIGLPELGFEVGFACVKPGRFAATRRAQQSPLVELPMGGRGDLRPALRLARLIRREGYALVHSHTPRAAMVSAAAAALARVPLVHHVHSQTAVEVGRRWLTRTTALVERLSLWRAAGLVAVSGSLFRYLHAHGYSNHRIWLVPNGVPVQGPLRPWNRFRSTWTLGVLAWLRPRKGTEVLLEAMALLKARGLSVRLRAVGQFDSDAYEREIKSRAAALGLADAVDWIGFRQDVTEQLRQMDVFVIPSVLSEAMPMSILESMAAGTPVVGTRVDGVTDLVEDGKDGLLAAPGDPQDLAHVLARLIGGKVDVGALRRAAHRKQAQRFSDASMAAGVAEVYREVLGR